MIGIVTLLAGWTIVRWSVALIRACCAHRIMAAAPSLSLVTAVGAQNAFSGRLSSGLGKSDSNRSDRGLSATPERATNRTLVAVQLRRLASSRTLTLRLSLSTASLACAWPIGRPFLAITRGYDDDRTWITRHSPGTTTAYGRESPSSTFLYQYGHPEAPLW